MNRGALLKVVESRYARTDLPEFRPGDTVRVAYRVKEGGRTRIQNFEGIVIKIKRNGYNSSFTVRKVSYGVGVERIFPFNSPLIEKVEIVQRAAPAGPSSTSSASFPSGRSAASSGPTASGSARTRNGPRRPRPPRWPRRPLLRPRERARPKSTPPRRKPRWGPLRGGRGSRPLFHCTGLTRC
jgi:ribosomal protein L19